MKISSLTLITGNQAKADQVSRYLQFPVRHEKIDLLEIQDPDPKVVVEHKVREAYKKVQSPVLVDDNALIIHSLGKLPGTFVKFFEQELGYEKICRIVDMTDDRSAQAIVALGLFDGTKTNIFTGTINGIIAQHPFGSGGFGWDTIFIPDGYTQTRAEMNEKDYDATSPRLKALEALMQFVKED